MPPRKIVAAGRSASVPLAQHASPYLNEEGECDHRKFLRNRFVFYTESHKPRKLEPLAAESYSTFHHSSRDLVDNEPIADIAAAVVRRALQKAKTLLRDEMKRRADIMSGESAQRHEVERMCSITEEQLRADEFESTITHMSMVDAAEADNSSFFTLNSSFIIPKPRASFQGISANSRSGFLLVAKEASRRQAMESQLIADMRALVRAAKREIAAAASRLEHEEKERTEAERLAKAERDWREHQLEEGTSTLVAEEELAQYCTIAIPEMAERSIVEAYFRDGLHAINLSATAKSFDEVMTGHFKLLAAETSKRDGIDTEQNHGFIQLKGAMLLIDRLLASESLKRNIGALCEREQYLRKRREESFTALREQQMVEMKAVHRLELYQQMWRDGMNRVGPSSVAFLSYLECEARQAIDDEWQRFEPRTIPDWTIALFPTFAATIGFHVGAAARPPSTDPSASGTEDARSSQVVSRHSAGSARRPWSRPTNSASMAHRVPTGRHDTTSLPPMPPPQSVERNVP